MRKFDTPHEIWDYLTVRSLEGGGNAFPEQFCILLSKSWRFRIKCQKLL